MQSLEIAARERVLIEVCCEELALHKIIVFSKPGCHICERAIENLQSFSKTRTFELEIVDITKNDELFKTYMLKIPVIQLDGKDVFVVEEIALAQDSKAKLQNLVLSLKD